MKTHVVTEVVKNDLCCDCGVCSGVCPADALPMAIQPNGDLTPDILEYRCESKPGCRLCLAVCPMVGGLHDPRQMNELLFGPGSGSKATFHEDIGWHRIAVVGFREDATLRRSSASGGLATWCLEKLLTESAVTRTAVVRFAQQRDKGMFEFYSASTVEEIRNSTGSVYQPIEISHIIREVLADRQQKWAIIGVPCLCAGVRRLKHLRKQIPYVLGMACGMYQNMYYTELLLHKSGVHRDEVKDIEYRGESRSGEASNFSFWGTGEAMRGKAVSYKPLPAYLGRHAHFRLNACNYCMDVFAETADACFMDAWLPAFRNDPEGTSIVVVRHSALADLFDAATHSDEIKIRPISSDQVTQSQRGHVRRKRKLIHMRMGTSVPPVGASDEPKLRERLDWFLQRRVQSRS